MGKQWNWGGNGRATTFTRKLKNGRFSEDEEEEEASSSAGCMCSVFQLFDFNLNPTPSPASIKQVSHQKTKKWQILNMGLKSSGTEAPRNSLESDEEFPLSTKHEHDLRIPMGVVQIKTRSEGNSNDCFAGESPSTKTPTLVARLMGLDLLPQINSPATTPRTSSQSPNYPILSKLKPMGHRSLPETPRTSCERKSSVENYHHRLSLQIPSSGKENSSPNPRHYPREIVKQVKQSVSRKAGLDITNYSRRDEELIQTKPKKVLSTSSSGSPRRRAALEVRNVNNSRIEISKEKKQRAKTEPLVQIPTDGHRKRSKKEINEKYGRPARIMKNTNKQEGSGKKCRKIPLSNDLLNFSSVPTVLMKKDPSISSAKLPQIQLSRFQNQQPQMSEDVIHLKKDAAAVSTTGNNRSNRHDMMAELAYVRQILSRTSSPVYSVFLQGHNNEVSITHQSDRTLLSDLVAELLTPYAAARTSAGGCRRRIAVLERWPDLVEKVCDKVRSFPRAKCQVLEDIDGILEKDLDRSGIQDEEEEEGIAKEIEDGILEELLRETVSFWGTGWQGNHVGYSRDRCQMDGGGPSGCGKRVTRGV